MESREKVQGYSRKSAAGGAWKFGRKCGTAVRDKVGWEAVKPKDSIPKESGGALGVHHVGGGNMRGVVDKRGVSAGGISISDGSY
jgi:hypothetical protein